MRIHVTNDPTFPYMITDSNTISNHWQGVQKNHDNGRVYMYAYNYTYNGRGVYRWDWDKKIIPTTS